MPTSICRHIKTNGIRCGSPALTDQALCYFHKGLQHRHRRPQPTSGNAPTLLHPMLADSRGQREPLLAEYFAPQPQTLELPPLEDRESIQVAISVLVAALAENRLDPKRASMLLYGLQVASSNCNRLNLFPSQSGIVRETVLAPTGEAIALDEDPESEIAYQPFLKEEEEDDEDCDCSCCQNPESED